ncbi:hypothetical protein UlMin_027064 [Ulmus minor]
MKIHHLYTIFNITVFLKFCIATDTITINQSITDGNTSSNTLVSSAKIFELGFFSPGNSNNRYIGIWYRTTPDVVVWVANRNNPLTDSYGQFTINNTTNQLVLLNRSKIVVWSSNSAKRVPKNPVVRLLDSGNLVFGDDDSTTSKLYLWQSFDYPTDTIIAGMKVGWDSNTGLERYLTSWKSADDPSTGDFALRMNINGLPQVILSMGSTRKFRSGTWNGVRFNGLPEPSNETVFQYIFIQSGNESYDIFLPEVNSSILCRVTVHNSGTIQRLSLHNGSPTQWDLIYSIPFQQCDHYGFCGPNSICKVDLSPLCECLEGFTQSSQEEWRVLMFSKGCRRKIPLDCQKGEGFVKVDAVKLPDLIEFSLNKSMTLKECRQSCLNNCSCKAYANSYVRNGGTGCLMWFSDLIDVKEIHAENSQQEMYIRLSASEIKHIRDENNKKILKTIIIAVSTTTSICILGLVFWRIFWKSRTKAKGRVEDIELPLFDLPTIAIATNNFSPENMIGVGGFGPVYRGKLWTGQEVAVKRLSKNSGQGLKEFKTEVELIAKLQHRNLVALLGCCIEREETMLIYEYMPNKSLDRFIFESQRSTTLPWEKHFNIVMGIARGLLYLHQDSKLHVIHRDLKASNILLDNNLNPKISDFGLARIFGDDEKEARTKIVVGTYGYMSPEYAIDGKFSIKSDVFSFGVLLLEIVSGKRNRSFHHPDHDHNLLGHAWLLWKDEKALELMDESFKDSCIESQVLRCIHVGLLCVQKLSHDRPRMSSVVFMLENEEALLPQPKQPGFFTERSSRDDHSTPKNEGIYSENVVTITMPNGR